MSEQALFTALVYGSLGVATVVAILLFFVSAPYGRHQRGGWGPLLHGTLGWVVMEAPAPIVFAWCFFHGDPARTRSLPGLVCFVLWQAHYLHRSFLFPFQRRGGHNTMPLWIAAFGFLFNTLNGYLNGRWLYTLGPALPAEWVRDPRFLGGLGLFAFGYAVNRHADWILLRLRAPGETGYKIPHGGLYRWLSCPNYFGECVEWIGWALLTGSLPGLGFAIWTAANLVPRARSHHRWYQERFPDYPKERRAIVPFVF